MCRHSYPYHMYCRTARYIPTCTGFPLFPRMQALVLQAVRLLPHLLCDARVDQAYLDRLCSPEAHAVVLPLRALSVPEEQALRQLHNQFQAQKQERVQAQDGGTSDGHGLRNLRRPCKPVGAVRRGTQARALTLPRRHSQVGNMCVWSYIADLLLLQLWARETARGTMHRRALA